MAPPSRSILRPLHRVFEENIISGVRLCVVALTVCFRTVLLLVFCLQLLMAEVDGCASASPPNVGGHKSDAMSY
ncbi:hypothetical protein V6N11_012971 [Hibiscus sabdariffa]|uniref:Transmembrane protein n=1 Tax=Hibiscus sabdariffa TaxID=183260 RepID=A0ABR2A007_9ROSI